MARSRNIKPSFFTNDVLAENDPLGRLLFIGLWTLADHNGNLEWRAKRVKAQILPYDNCDVEALAINLDKSGFIRFYSVGGQTYLNIPTFTDHQNPHKNEREKGSETPEYSDEARQSVDIKGLTINRDKSGLKPESSQSDRADSLLLNPDSFNLNPDSPQPDSVESSADKSAKFSMTAKKLVRDYGVDEQVAADFLKVRKAKRLPLTETAWNGLVAEFEKAGITVANGITMCAQKGWAGFSATWGGDKNRPTKQSAHVGFNERTYPSHIPDWALEEDNDGKA